MVQSALVLVFLRRGRGGFGWSAGFRTWGGGAAALEGAWGGAAGPDGGRGDAGSGCATLAEAVSR